MARHHHFLETLSQFPFAQFLCCARERDRSKIASGRLVSRRGRSTCLNLGGCSVKGHRGVSQDESTAENLWVCRGGCMVPYLGEPTRSNNPRTCSATACSAHKARKQAQPQTCKHHGAQTYSEQRAPTPYHGALMCEHRGHSTYQAANIWHVLPRHSAHTFGSHACNEQRANMLHHSVYTCRAHSTHVQRYGAHTSIARAAPLPQPRVNVECERQMLQWWGTNPFVPRAARAHAASRRPHVYRTAHTRAPRAQLGYTRPKLPKPLRFVLGPHWLVGLQPTRAYPLGGYGGLLATRLCAVTMTFKSVKPTQLCLRQTKFVSSWSVTARKRGTLVPFANV